ncbi:uncharacterized protein LOC106168486 [Lingula anatina]|uniref:Uncharacterized protein LOC106168486 n=1 Tax=Lingula anatina TaxID=7574 RepID=A0A1S3IYA6_LINAN|nr:uncharacterized protein LOC106168486 [Lingula anatina]|eukprot:XP_013403008.1 uncharacterized protein LOC106168486 [Lingula anatina]
MSATIQGDLFLKYFAKEEEIKLMSQASIFVGTKRYPVELVYLENINQRFGSDLTSFQKVKLATLIMKYNQTTPAHYLTSDDPSDQPIKEFLLELKDAHLYNAVGKRLAASREAKGSSVTDLEYDLALTLIRLSAVPGESILVFLPGKFRYLDVSIYMRNSTFISHVI